MMAVDLHNTGDEELLNHNYSCWSTFSDSSSALSSPVDSELASSETTTTTTEEENNDYIAELTRQMAHQMLEDDDEQDPTSEFKRNPDLNSKQSLIDKQIQFYKRRQEYAMKNKHKDRKLNQNEIEEGLKLPASRLSNLYRGARSDVRARAVFISNQSGSRTGTGVFLPRGTTSVDPHRKTGSTTILIPAKVVQALQVHYDKMGKHFVGSSTTTVPSAAGDQEIGLPQEWTY